MATRKLDVNVSQADVSLPFAALQLVAPPVRLVSAALWKVMKRRDVMQYGVVEEFVTSACETVPGLLTVRHQGKLTLGLRARVILELCRTQPDVEVIQPHLERIRVPVSASSSSRYPPKTDQKIQLTVKHFKAFVQKLLTDPAEREQFFEEEFPVEYGPKFDLELEKLLWEFLIRLDQLLPVPNLAQTVSWLSDAPPVLEECAQAATQPQLLETILQHQRCLGHLESAASLPPNMGDSILASLSLPPSGRVISKLSADQCPAKKPLVTPVFGLISNEDVPVMKRLQSNKPTKSNDSTDKKSQNFTSIKQRGDEDESASNGTKRKQSGSDSSDSEEDAVVVRRQGKKKPSRQRTNKSSQNKGKGPKSEGVQTASMLHLPEDPAVRSAVASCLRNQPRVLVKRLPVASVGSRRSGKGGITSSSSSATCKEPRRKSPVKLTSCRQTPESRLSDSDDKENLPELPSESSSSSSQQSATGDGDEYVADSEDEATKNFKGRLFMKRYCKTKHGTFVPTLREFWKPSMRRGSPLSSARKHR